MADMVVKDVPAGRVGLRGSDGKRARIIEVAVELISSRGFAATSTREISERLGFTKAALYYHFRTKDDLLEAIIQPVKDDLAELIAEFSASLPKYERYRIVEGYVDLVISHADLIRVLSSDPSVRHNTAVMFVSPMYQRLTQLLSGSSEPSTEERATVRAALGAVHAGIINSAEGDDPGVVRAAVLSAACGALRIKNPHGFLRK